MMVITTVLLAKRIVQLVLEQQTIVPHAQQVLHLTSLHPDPVLVVVANIYHPLEDVYLILQTVKLIQM